MSPPVAGFPSPLPDYPAGSGRGHGGAEQTARVALLLKVRYMVSVIRELARDDDGAAVNVTSLAVLALKILIMESQLKARMDCRNVDCSSLRSIKANVAFYGVPLR